MTFRAPHRTNWLSALRICLFGIAIALGGQAQAQAQSCSELRAHLASASRGGSPAEAIRLDRAIRQQQAAIARVSATAEAPDCRGFLAGFRSRCSQARQAMSGMQQNLAALRAARADADTGGNGRTIRRLQNALAEAGCSARERSAPPAARLSDPAPPSQARPSGQGVFRTLCVRTCDGYFFPVSHQSSRQDFARDAAACESMCPGTAVELFYHRMVDEESADMVSARDDQPYAATRNAFAYKSVGYRQSDGCSCTSRSGPKGFTVIAGEAPAPAWSTLEAPVGRPDIGRAGPSPSISPVMGTLRGTRAAPTGKPVPAVTAAPEVDERAVRVVGPTFLPDQ